MKDLTLITCSYNTPEVTMTMLRSFVAKHPEFTDIPIILMENSTDDKTSELLDAYEVPYISNKGWTHGKAVNEALKLVKTRNALLLDTDIVFVDNHESIYQKFRNKDLVAMGELQGDRGGKKLYKRIAPWWCFLSAKELQKHDITFFDEERTKASFDTDKIYDVGSTMFEDIRKAKLNIGAVQFNYMAGAKKPKYIHYEGMSWYTNKYDASVEDTRTLDWDSNASHNNRGLFEEGEKRKLVYINEIKEFRNIPITGRYKVGF